MKTLQIIFGFTAACTIIAALTILIVTERQKSVTPSQAYLAANCYDADGFISSDICNQYLTGKGF